MADDSDSSGSGELPAKDLDPLMESNLALLSVRRIGAWAYNVEYVLHLGLNVPGPVTYSLQRSKDNMTGWLTVTVLSQDNDGIGEYPDSFMSGDLKNTVWYRVACQAADGQIYYSASVEAGVHVHDEDRIAIKNICDAFYLRCTLGTGTMARLIRGYEGGNCPVCYDDMQGGATDPSCPTCHGTGKDKAYTSSEEFPITIKTERINVRAADGGNVFSSRVMCTSPAIPWPLQQDLIVVAYGIVFRVSATPNQFKYVTAIRNSPVIISYEVSELPANAPEYAVLEAAGFLTGT